MNPLAWMYRLSLLAAIAMGISMGCDGTTAPAPAATAPLTSQPEASQTEASQPEGTQRVELGGETFYLEVANANAERFQGLSDRASIAEDGGMLFVFPDRKAGVQTFVMRDCLVPIDIAFLDEEGRVVRTHAMRVESANTPEMFLQRYSSGSRAQFAIEVAGGTLKRVGLERGDVVSLPLARLKAEAE